MADIIVFPVRANLADQLEFLGQRSSGAVLDTYRRGQDPLSTKFEFRAPLPVSTDALGRGIYNPEESQAIREYFDFFGVTIVPRAYIVSGLLSAFAWFQGEIKTRAVLKKTDPQVYDVLYSPASTDEHAYIDALLARDSVAAAEALCRTPFIFQLLDELGQPFAAKRV